MAVFQFKAFAVRQEKAAMKVGTDGVLLGAWAPLDHVPETVLDVGAGTGLLALMLAQRSGAAVIDAVEIEPGAFEECVHNFEESPWADRLFCYHSAFEVFAAEMEESYELILSNPPFYEAAVDSSHPNRDMARQQNSLPPQTLLAGVIRLLDPHGTFCLILPHGQEEPFRALAADMGLFPYRITRVKGNPQAPIKRSLLAFSFNRVTPVEELLVLEEARHQYTPEYLELVRDFYLKL